MMLRFENLESRRLAAVDLANGIESTEAATQSTGEPLTAAASMIGQACSASVPQIVHEQAEGEVAHLDVDQDGFITYSDVEAVFQQLSGNALIGPMQPEGENDDVQDLTDVNRDGVLTPLDAITILNRVHFYNSLVPCNCGQCLANAVVDGV